ncbi:serine hydrolase [Salipiger pallidus]|uniref:Serine hydrolase n=1 Tax=Salipiger pallidus TaxID=1775170 RepID=A0A8J3EGT3_9RHOB|nr:serine hydrolase domain-containing protein [Salipiger pallidus]GGG73048.1 serine hydrolase [Salipiger pallidus]
MAAPDCHVAWIDETHRQDGPPHVFPWWSFTKTVIAALALSLAGHGKLALDARGDGMTLRQLLTHTAGLPDYGPLPSYAAAVRADEEPWKRGRLTKAAMAQGCDTPGTGFRYSNLGYMLARERIEAASGLPLGEAIASYITDPLGLTRVRLARSREDFAMVHWPEARRYHPGWVYHGCLIGTAGDAARLLHALLGGAVLPPLLLEEMLTTRPVGGALPDRPWTRCGYGLGLMIGDMHGQPAIGHSGAGPFSAGAVYHFPSATPPRTVAAFCHGPSEAPAEAAAFALSGHS